MMHTPASLPSHPNTPINKIVPVVRWVVKERQGGVWVPVHTFKNLVTNYGLTAFASAPSGQYTAPTYLTINSAYVTMYSGASPGATSIQLSGDPTLSGDTQLVLSVGLAAQETVTITGITGTNPVTVTLSSALVNSHALGDHVVRQVASTDTMASVTAEVQYDPTYNPNNRMALTSAYSPGVGQSTMQYFFSGATLTNVFMSHVGLCDQQVIGAINANLHNYAVLGYNHNNTNDVEIDVNYTLQVY